MRIRIIGLVISVLTDLKEGRLDTHTVLVICTTSLALFALLAILPVTTSSAIMPW